MDGVKFAAVFDVFTHTHTHTQIVPWLEEKGMAYNFLIERTCIY